MLRILQCRMILFPEDIQTDYQLFQNRIRIIHYFISGLSAIQSEGYERKIASSACEEIN